MNRHRYICLAMFFLIPFFYPLCWWPMRYTGWVFWSEPNDIVKHLWTQISLMIQQPDTLRKKDWVGLFIVASLTYIPYWITVKIAKAVWIVYLRPYF